MANLMSRLIDLSNEGGDWVIALVSRNLFSIFVFLLYIMCSPLLLILAGIGWYRERYYPEQTSQKKESCKDLKSDWDADYCEFLRSRVKP